MTTGQFTICDFCKHNISTEKCELCGKDMCGSHISYIVLETNDVDCEFGINFTSVNGDIKICINCKDRLREIEKGMAHSLRIGRQESLPTEDQQKIRKDICKKILSIMEEEGKVFLI